MITKRRNPSITKRRNSFDYAKKSFDYAKKSFDYKRRNPLIKNEEIIRLLIMRFLDYKSRNFLVIIEEVRWLSMIDEICCLTFN